MILWGKSGIIQESQSPGRQIKIARKRLGLVYFPIFVPLALQQADIKTQHRFGFLRTREM